VTCECESERASGCHDPYLKPLTQPHPLTKAATTISGPRDKR